MTRARCGPCCPEREDRRVTGPDEEAQGEVGWFCVRCVFRSGGDSASRMYEERLTLWRAEGFDEAIAFA